MFQKMIDDGGRKWALCQQVFWTSTAMTVGAVIFFVKREIDPMTALYWWSSVQGVLFSLYGAANIITKKVAGPGVQGADVVSQRIEQ
jgi:hypothetical protein